ncbi:MAG: hypothetical protein CMK09_04120 [Ponticaulis sp.]|nr:hypothetical protein [Ponticaulis sp.]|tara:strand:+ start:30702 stop:31016 length:315 start_codon:yes stop_codon:yes gene_type:complete
MFLFSLLGSLGRSSAKLVASFVLVIVMMVLAFAFMPEAIRSAQDHIEGINDMVRTPPLLDDQGLILYRTLVNENTIFGILMTLIARAIIEIVSWVFGQGFSNED